MGHASQGSLQGQTQGCWAQPPPQQAQHCSGQLPSDWSAALCLCVAACPLRQVWPPPGLQAVSTCSNKQDAADQPLAAAGDHSSAALAATTHLTCRQCPAAPTIRAQQTSPLLRQVNTAVLRLLRQHTWPAGSVQLQRQAQRNFRGSAWKALRRKPPWTAQYLWAHLLLWLRPPLLPAGQA